MMEAISTGLFSHGIRYHVADNMARALPFGPETALLTSIKQMFGLVCIFGVFFLLVYMLYDVPPVRSTMKKIPYWNQVGKTARSILHQAQTIQAKKTVKPFSNLFYL